MKKETNKIIARETFSYLIIGTICAGILYILFGLLNISIEKVYYSEVILLKSILPFALIITFACHGFIKGMIEAYGEIAEKRIKKGRMLFTINNMACAGGIAVAFGFSFIEHLDFQYFGDSAGGMENLIIIGMLTLGCFGGYKLTDI